MNLLVPPRAIDSHLMMYRDAMHIEMYRRPTYLRLAGFFRKARSVAMTLPSSACLTC